MRIRGHTAKKFEKEYVKLSAATRDGCEQTSASGMGVKLDPESVAFCGPRIFAVSMFRRGAANILGLRQPQENRHSGAEGCLPFLMSATPFWAAA